ncbi:MAG: HEPN domain-containing protein [Cyclobacteriaceae bacterium]|nr:HEPN domain-containing protein [Cyclobacteriaceae bacterium]
MTDKERRDIVAYRLERANETLLEVNLLLENGMFNGAINRLYYAITSLLVKNEIGAQTHSGVRQMFGLHFVKTALIDNELGKFYSHLFNKRHTGDYENFVEYSKEEVYKLLDPTKELIKAVKNLIN